ncbi:MAG: thymidylate synthase [Desulfurococcaceae archaeon]
MRLIQVVGRNLPEAWEQSLVKLSEVGVTIDTEYSERSIDAPAVIIVEDPFAEPRVHLKGIVAGSLRGLLDYVDEVIKGVHDYLVEKVGYTYHERLFSYSLPNGTTIDQVSKVIEKLKNSPYTRRAQAITWQPWKDLETEHPPCLQRAWFRVVEGKLIMHVNMRSLDYKEPVLLFRDGIVDFIPIGEVCEEELWKEALTATIDDGLSIRWKSIANCIKHKLSEREKIYEVRLKSGRWIRLSKDHALFILKDGGLAPILTEQLKVGDLVAIPKDVLHLREQPKLLDAQLMLFKKNSLSDNSRSYLRAINVGRAEAVEVKPILNSMFEEEGLKNVHSAVWNSKSITGLPTECEDESVAHAHLYDKSMHVGCRAEVELIPLITDVAFDAVVEIRETEPTTSYVYDLSVPPYENFIGGHGGIMVHNSNDAFKAAYMNMYAFTELQKLIAQKIGVDVGYYMHIADSYHVYERDFKWFNVFVQQIKSGESKKRWRTTQQYLQMVHS